MLTFSAAWRGSLWPHKPPDLRRCVFARLTNDVRDFLRKAWPGVPIHDDIKTFDGKRWGGATLLTAGVPCQPASRAGKQRGKEDDRWLWPEAIRVFSDVRPTWAIFENPPGIGDVGLAGILADVESKGYEVRVFGVPACAVGMAQNGLRYYAVASSTFQRQQGPRMRRPRHSEKEVRANREANRSFYGYTAEGWTWLPCADGKVRRAPDDTFGLVDGLHRSVLGALGNGIVPAVVYQITKAIAEIEEGT